MDRKKGLSFIGLLVLGLMGALLTSTYHPKDAKATTATVGSSAQLKGNGVNTISTLPSQPGTMTCFSVSVATNTPTLVMAADGARMAFWVVNASSGPLTPGVPSNSRPPIVILTTTTATNIGVNPTNTLFSRINGLMLFPSHPDRGLLNMGSGPGSWGMQGTSVYRGALYAIAESSTTATWPQQGIVDGCTFDP